MYDTVWLYINEFPELWKTSLYSVLKCRSAQEHSWREGGCCSSKGWQNWPQNEILNEKNFVRSTNFRLLIKIKGNSINVTFFNLIICVTGSHCAYTPWKPENLAIPLSPHWKWDKRVVYNCWLYGCLTEITIHEMLTLKYFAVCLK